MNINIILMICSLLFQFQTNFIEVENKLTLIILSQNKNYHKLNCIEALCPDDVWGITSKATLIINLATRRGWAIRFFAW
jgi:hypothetical protein